ncbi:carboxypeptidase-like regulatory domain-containing protein [Engelhardtia mirabilis]|uniref:Nickel uptake substrate-specific transmembrane region n=1 Tax=Engelhardtia mirabilis TaxID=2528011 RepID=A0A518BLZ2_9BACT|nr:hypothetical protein Pla133_30890 [Planctomycetes bacterium Pla133]QDV02324.1 hypothetical protein Pla86_30880 [Planctomycetes bacterium Pla86]
MLVQPQGAASEYLTGVRVTGSSPVDVGLIEVQSGASIRLTVLDAQGLPMAGVSVSVSDGSAVMARRTDGDGQLLLQGLRAGTCSASMMVEGVPFVTVVEARAGDLVEAVLDLRERVVATWTARMLFADGSPAAGVHVRAVATDLAWTSSTATSDHDGRFELQGELNGPTLLEVYGVREQRGRVQELIEFDAPGSGPESIRLPGASLVGRFTGASTGLRLRRCAWSEEAPSAFLANRGGSFVERDGSSGEAFEIGYLSAGRYELVWVDRDGQPLESVAIELGQGQRLQL